ncbi:hypothetical protein RchiOBHm_Chr2g0160401 [Rosa chinensis]|uniref:Uncharacterized protein n=1 Tax=Rosa chinensis TaxID=74649 RepID=A0A2P6S2I8_ROSCH|nr:hypothetical protein RchiOBHm_Chr2g0160401 [Rosa chinensis]
MKKKKRETGKGREEKVNERRRNRNVKRCQNGMVKFLIGYIF